MDVDLFEDLIWVWEIFVLLNRQRQVGSSGPQPISLTDINALLEMKQVIRSDDVELVLYIIPELDHIVLKQHYDEVEALAKKKSKSGANSRRR